MPRPVLAIERILELLAATPTRIETIAASLTPDELRAVSGENEWSATDVIAHLRACADVWGGCIREILAHETPTIRAINPGAWIERTNYRELDFTTSFKALYAQRIDLLELLSSLNPDQWLSYALVTGAGSPLERTVHSYAERMARHEQPHIKQIERIVSSNKRD